MAQPTAAATPATVTGALFTQRLDTFNAKFDDFLTTSVGEETDAQVTEANRAADVAYHAMLATPAPTETAVILKLDALHRYSKGSDHEEGEIEAILADAARLRAVDRSAWDAAFAVMQQAKAADAVINAAYEAAADTENHELATALTPEWERLGDATRDAEWALFFLPSPDYAALLWKSEYLFGECADRAETSPAWRTDIIAAYMVDVRRLLFGEAVA